MVRSVVMKERTAGEPAASAQPAETHPRTQGQVVLFAAIAASHVFSLSGHGGGPTAVPRERGPVLQAITERRGRIVSTGHDAVVATFANAIEALETAIAIQKRSIEAGGGGAALDICIFIHDGEEPVTDEDLRREVSGTLGEMADGARPGHIYVSADARERVQGLNRVEFRPLGEKGNGRTGRRPFYEVIWDPEAVPGAGVFGAAGAARKGRDNGPFAHGGTLLAGTYAPCFYCGSRKHRTTVCPSKDLPYATSGLERLGYLSMDEINGLFSDYLNRSGNDLPVIPEPASAEDQSRTYLAPWSYYELKKVFQLRFLDVVWNASSKADWHKAREKRGEGFPEGGMLWFARDCIRTSRLEEAEDVLRRYGRMTAGDYRTSCGLAFVKIEKESYITAVDLLHEALDQHIGNLQRTYLLLLLSRVYEFVPNLACADDKLRDALGIEPYCPEAMFEQIIRYFLGRREAEGTRRLVKLIHIYPEYYSAARISPELAKFHSTIAPELQKLVAQARGDADKGVGEADSAVALLKGFVGEDDRDMAQVLSSHRQMFELLDGPETLFNYEEVATTAARLITACKDLDRQRVLHAMTVIQKLEVRLGEAVQSSGQAQKAIALLQPILNRMFLLKESLEARAPLAPCLSQCEEMERETDAIEGNLKRMDAHHAFLQIWTRFSKDFLLASFVTATIGFVLFPGALSLLHSFLPDSLSLDAGDTWAAQKAILIAGGLFAVIFACFHTLAERRGPGKAKSEC